VAILVASPLAEMGMQRIFKRQQHPENVFWFGDAISMEPVCSTVVQKFLLAAKDLLASVVLVGSHAVRRAREGSDIDLIVIARGDREAEAIRVIADRLNRGRIRPVLDCKVYTEREFLQAKSGRENRFLWTCLVNGKVLSGRDITHEVRLLPGLVKDAFWTHVQYVEDACDKLREHVQFTGSCFRIYDALATTYFVERFILNVTSPNLSKEDFVQSYLGHQYEKVRDRYYWVMRHIRSNAVDTLRVPASADRKFGREEYTRVRGRGLAVLRLLHTRSRQVTEWGDSADRP